MSTSRLAAVEVPRAARRAGGAAADVEGLLRRCLLVPFDRGVEESARFLAPAELRSLDAIHLASMLRMGDALAAALVYDRRLAAAARAEGIRVEAPGQARI